jgi:sorbitol-specific phosphotransferase system component IIBC
MNLGLRAILLIAAVVSFIICIFATVHYPDWLAVGLACLAGAFAVSDLGLDRPIGTGGRTNT